MKVAENTERRVARIVWNTQFWKEPSSVADKIKNRNAYENKYGYGHEEWLFDYSKQIDGFQYAYIQAISKLNYEERKFDLYLISRDVLNNTFYWIGMIKDVQNISYDEALQIQRKFIQKGFVKEMKAQLNAINVNKEYVDDFEYIPNFKFKKENVEIYSTPKPISKDNPNIKSTYYSTLFYFKPFDDKTPSKMLFRAGLSAEKEQVVVSYNKHLKEISKLHPVIKKICFEKLCIQYGKSKVGSEIKTAIGTQIDIVVQITNEKYILYEIKSYPSIRENIRQALSQLLEYANYGEELNIDKLVIVSQEEVDALSEQYLNLIRNKYYIPIYYQQVNLQTGELSKLY